MIQGGERPILFLALNGQEHEQFGTFVDILKRQVRTAVKMKFKTILKQSLMVRFID